MCHLTLTNSASLSLGHHIYKMNITQEEVITSSNLPLCCSSATFTVHLLWAEGCTTIQQLVTVVLQSCAAQAHSDRLQVAI